MAHPFHNERLTFNEVKVLKYTVRPKSKYPIKVTLVQVKALNPRKGK